MNFHACFTDGKGKLVMTVPLMATAGMMMIRCRAGGFSAEEWRRGHMSFAFPALLLNVWRYLSPTASLTILGWRCVGTHLWSECMAPWSSHKWPPYIYLEDKLSSSLAILWITFSTAQDLLLLEAESAHDCLHLGALMLGSLGLAWYICGPEGKMFHPRKASEEEHCQPMSS